LKKFSGAFREIPLFEHIEAENLLHMLPCVNARVKHYRRGEIILLTGDKVRDIGVILSGSAQVLKEDLDGNRNIYANLQKTDIFAETFAYAGIEKSPVSVVATADADVLLLDFRRTISVCKNLCTFHSQLIENMLRLTARKNIEMSNKISCLGRRTTEEKAEAFLTLQMETSGENPFTIPFSRAQMADYLCVDRSALSAVLCRMRDEGKLRFTKNRFELFPKKG